MKCTSCGRVVKPVVAIDIDGTLADYHGHFTRFVYAYYDRILPKSQPPWDGEGEFEDYLGITKADYRECKLAYRQGGMKRTQPMFPGAVNLVKQAQVAGAEVWLTTTRPYNRLDSTDPDTRWWLERAMVPYDHLLYDDRKYERLASLVEPMRVVTVVDDLAEMCAAAELTFPVTTTVWQIARHHNEKDRWLMREHIRVITASMVGQINDWKDIHVHE